MFEIGWTELLVIGVVALIVIGPKDLPEMFRQLGRFTGKMRSMARDFQRAMDQAAKDTGLNDVARDLKAAGSMKPTALNAVKEAANKFEKWDPLQNSARPTLPATPPIDRAATILAPGPETQALLDAQAKRQAIVAETTERLRAVSAKPAAVADSPAVADPSALHVAEKPTRKPRTKAAAAEPVPAPEAKPGKAAAKTKTKATSKAPSKAGEA